MIRFIYTLVILLFLSVSSYAQDTIQIDNGQPPQVVTITSTDNSVVKYYLFSDAKKRELMVGQSRVIWYSKGGERWVNPAYANTTVISQVPAGPNEKPVETVTITAGDELIKASKTYFIGFGMTVVGGTISAVTVPLGLPLGVAYVGAIAATVGGIVQVAAWANIAKAGKKLNEQQPK